MTAYTTAYKPRRIGKIRISQKDLFDWLDLPDAVLLRAGVSPADHYPIVELLVEHRDMPDMPLDGTIAEVVLVHSVAYHEYHDKPVRTSPKRED